jgi:hypothetical protein
MTTPPLPPSAKIKIAIHKQQVLLSFLWKSDALNTDQQELRTFVSIKMPFLLELQEKISILYQLIVHLKEPMAYLKMEPNKS